LLEGAKLLHYIRWSKTADAAFALFAVVFIVTRCVSCGGGCGSG
jgi:hypothetical protein